MFGNLCALSFFVWWVISLLSPSYCVFNTVGNISNDSGITNRSNDTIRFDLFPRLYGVIAASGLIFSVVATLVCCTMILSHTKKLSKNTSVDIRRKSLLNSVDGRSYNRDVIPEYTHEELPLPSTSKSSDCEHVQDNGVLLQSIKQTFV